MALDANKEASEQLLRGFQYLMEQMGLTQIYNGTIVATGTNRATIQLNGQTHIIPQYGSMTTQAVGKAVKVFIPQGNMNLAFFI